MTNNINKAWWNHSIDELEQAADDDGVVRNRTMKVTNPYSGQSTMLTPKEHKLYIEIKQAEWDEDYDTVRKGLDKFSRLNAKAYMVLRD